MFANRGASRLRLENKQRALRAAFEPVRWVDENETYVEFEA